MSKITLSLQKKRFLQVQAGRFPLTDNSSLTTSPVGVICSDHELAARPVFRRSVVTNPSFTANSGSGNLASRQCPDDLSGLAFNYGEFSVIKIRNKKIFNFEKFDNVRPV